MTDVPTTPSRQRWMAAMVALTLLAFLCQSASASGTGKPNIIILFADDLGYGDLGSYGHPYNRTPNLDQLAAEGQRWTDFYVAAPVCSPSRGALLTGKYPTRSGLYGRQINVLFPNDSVGMPAAERTLPEALKEQGYATAIIGKWHLGDAPDVLPTRHGFDEWYGLPYSNDMDWVGEPDFDAMVALRAQGRLQELQASVDGRLAKYFDPKVDYWNVPLLRSRCVDGRCEDTIVERPAQQPELTKRYTSEALAFIDRNRRRPFLLYLPYSMPHTPIFRSDAFARRSLGGRYGDVIEELDWSVGAIVERLKALGIDRRTLVLFTSDNGPWRYMREHAGSAGLLRDGKGTTFEGGQRVPAIFWGPGRVKPQVVSELGTALDVYATALALAGAAPTPDIDGLDLSAVLRDGRASPRATFAYYRSGELRAFRKGRFKLHLILEGAYGLPPGRTVPETPVLYDLSVDPGEQFDVAARYPDVVTDILREIDRHRAGLVEQPPLFDQRLARLAARPASEGG